MLIPTGPRKDSNKDSKANSKRRHDLIPKNVKDAKNKVIIRRNDTSFILKIH